MKQIDLDSRIIYFCRVKKFIGMKKKKFEKCIHLSPFFLPECWIVCFPDSALRLSILAETLSKTELLETAENMKT